MPFCRSDFFFDDDISVFPGEQIDSCANQTQYSSDEDDIETAMYGCDSDNTSRPSRISEQNDNSFSSSLKQYERELYGRIGEH
jgi:hypothetical protein